MKDTCTIWVCIDCMLHHANGECGSCHTDEGHDREPLNRINPAAGDEIAMGLGDEDHPCGIPFIEREDCDCEFRSFSWSSCDGCGSTLGGERHAMTLWFD